MEEGEELNEGYINVIKKTKQPVAAWTIETLRTEQKCDETLGKYYTYLQQGGEVPPSENGIRVEDLRFSGDILHMVEEGKGTREGQPVTRVMVPTSLVQNLIYLYHDSVIAGHRGVDQTIAQITAKYWVLGLRAQVDEYIRNCEKCIQFRKQPRKNAPIYRYEIIPRPFHQIHLDILGPLPTTKAHKKYVTVYVDRLT